MQKFKLSIDSQAGESKNTKMKQKQNLFNNASIISKWIDEFDPKTVNDVLPGPMQEFNKVLKNSKRMADHMTLIPKSQKKVHVTISRDNTPDKSPA